MTKETLSTRLTLLEKIKNTHDERSWHRFFVKYEGYLMRFIRSRGVPEHDAKDIMQNVFVRSFAKLPQFNYDAGKGLFRNWLATLACNEIFDFYRKKKEDRLVYIQGEKFPTKVLELLSDITESEIERMAFEESKAFILDLAMTRLEGKLGTEVIATYKMLRAGKTPKEISVELGVDDSTVYRHKTKAEKEFLTEFRRIKAEYPLL